MPKTNALTRFADLAKTVFAHCPAVTSILVENSYDHFRDEAYVSEDYSVRFVASVPDADLDLVPGVRRLEREAADLIMGAIDYTNDGDGIQESVCLAAEPERLYAYIQTNQESCARALVWDSFDNVMLETGRPEIWLSFFLPSEASGHERLSLAGISTLDEFRQNDRARRCLDAEDFSFADFPGNVTVRVTVNDTLVRAIISVPDDVDIFS